MSNIEGENLSDAARIDQLEQIVLILLREVDRLIAGGPDNLHPKPKIRITRETEKQVFELKSIGAANAEIARLLGISKASVSLICNGKYRWTKSEQERVAVI